MRRIEILTLEVGSTITKANGFVRLPGGGFDHVAQGFAPTSVAAGDVGVGVDAGLADPAATSGLDPTRAGTLCNSSAARGLPDDRQRPTPPGHSLLYKTEHC